MSMPLAWPFRSEREQNKQCSGTDIEAPRGPLIIRLGLRPALTRASLAGVLVAMLLAGCGSGASSSSKVDSTPEKIDGTPSYEFEQDDLESAGGASDAVKEYCADAVSEAQRLGCESHATDEELP